MWHIWGAGTAQYLLDREEKRQELDVNMAVEILSFTIVAQAQNKKLNKNTARCEGGKDKSGEHGTGGWEQMK